MISTWTIFALFATPIFGLWASWILIEGQYKRRAKDFWVLGSAIAGILCIAVAGIAYGSIALQTHDVELLSGQITGKERENGHYVRSYQCNCTTDSKGNRSCQTCYEDRYTVKWWAESTLGSYTIKSLDESSKRVWRTPDPQRYTEIQTGDPVAKEHGYTNYMKGVPKEFLYNDNLGAPPELIASIPTYPEVYDFYKVNRVMDLSGTIPNEMITSFNKQIAERLKVLGPSKEVNILVLFGNVDSNLMYAVREKWQGGKKNDVTVILGVHEGNIATAEVLTWGKNELFKIQLQDLLKAHTSIDDEMLNVIFTKIGTGYERPHMKDYEDLRIHIRPSLTSSVLSFILLALAPLIAFGVVWNSKRTIRYRRGGSWMTRKLW